MCVVGGWVGRLDVRLVTFLGLELEAAWSGYSGRPSVIHIACSNRCSDTSWSQPTYQPTTVRTLTITVPPLQ